MNSKKSKNRTLLYMLFALCLGWALVIIIGYIIPRYNYMQERNWYEKDIDLIALDYFNVIHAEQCKPQITHYSYSYDKLKNNNNNQYPFSSVVVTICCNHMECTMIINNEEDSLKVVKHSLSNESSPPLAFVFFLQIILASIIISAILFSKWIKKKQIRLY